MAKLYVPIRVRVELENSYSFTPDYRNSTGELVVQGTEQYRAFKKQIESRLASRFPSISNVELDAKFSISSFDLHGVISFSIENADLILVHYLMLRSSLGAILGELAASITPVFKLGWKAAVVATGEVSKEAIDVADHPDKTDYSRAQVFFPPGSLSQEVIGERAPGADRAFDARSSAPTMGRQAPKRYSLIAAGIANVILILGAYALVAMSVNRTNESEKRILDAIDSPASDPENGNAPINNIIEVHLLPLSEQDEAPETTCQNDQGVRIIRNGQEVPCE